MLGDLDVFLHGLEALDAIRDSRGMLATDKSIDFSKWLDHAVMHDNVSIARYLIKDEGKAVDPAVNSYCNIATF